MMLPYQFLQEIEFQQMSAQNSIFHHENDSSLLGGFQFFDRKPSAFPYATFGNVKQPSVEQICDMKVLQQTQDTHKQEDYEHLTTHVVNEVNIIEENKIEDQEKNNVYDNNIFRRKKLKGSFKKNTNVPKTLVRIFFKHYLTFVKEYNNKDLQIHHNAVKKSIRAKLGTSNAYNIDHILTLLGRDSKLSQQNQKINRNILSRIIQNFTFDEILNSSYINGKEKSEESEDKAEDKKKNTISYMIAMKIYNIRCRSNTLTERVKIF